MISHTQSFQKLKDETQEIFDFAILVSYAVPFLRHKLKQHQSVEPTIPDTDMMPFKPDNFKRSTVPIGKVKNSASKYKAEIGKSIRLAGFSYFEAYVGEVIQEILEFHQASLMFESVSKSPKVSELEPETKARHSKLRERPKKAHRAQYAKSQAILSQVGFALPNERWLVVGLNRMKSLSKDYRAAQIPALLSEVLGLELTAAEKADFAAIRRARNRIAHGRPAPSDLQIRDAIEANHILRTLARKIDQHVLEYWMIADPVSVRHAGM